MTARKITNRKCPTPNEGGFCPSGSVVFNELAIDVILIASVNFWRGCYSTASRQSTVRRSRLLLCASITARMVRKACCGVTSSSAFFSIASRTLA